MASADLSLFTLSASWLPALTRMSDTELEARLQRFAWVERRALVFLLMHLAEFDCRRLYADRGHPSLFVYCTRTLGYSEQGAYKRIQAARAARTHPIVLERLSSGQINLGAVVVLAPYLRTDNATELLDAARGKTIRELERIVASLFPRADVPDRLRALPNASTPGVARIEQAQPSGESMAGVALPRTSEGELPRGSASVAESAAAASPLSDSPCQPPGAHFLKDALEPLSGRRFLFRFSGGESLHGKYDRALGLLRLRPATGAMEAVFERALDVFLDRFDPRNRLARRQARGARSRASEGASCTRSIRQALRDAVWERDEGRCVFLGTDGVRCVATRWLEIDHVVPYALGGRSDDIANLRLLCRAHNQLLARRRFGEVAMMRRGRRKRA